jgi:hypothetical protein
VTEREGAIAVERPTWAPDDVDLDRASTARVYDYYLGGAVRHLSALGVRQFLDLGSGIPTAGNVHEVAQESQPEASVVYVDLDPVAVAHGRAILESVPNAAAISGDLRRPAEVLANATLRSVLSFAEPVAVMLVSVLHFVTDEERPADIVAGYAAALVPGSYVVISHSGPTSRDLTEGEQEAYEVYRNSSTPVALRSADQVAELFGDLTIIEPGVVPAARWRPDDSADAPDSTVFSAAVGRKD